MQRDNIVPRQKQKAVVNFLPTVKPAIHKLALAFLYAHDVECDSWQFAVEIEKLTGIGMSMDALRWLVMKGYAKHAIEVTRPSDALRRFRPGKNLAFAERTGFVITDAGLSLLKGGSVSGEFGHSSENEALLPCWDREARILLAGEQIVKQYRVPSPNQEAVLDAFQEEGWPQFIHDPLPPLPNQPPKQRLRETIRGLNTNQKNALLHFRGNGTGERVCWETVGGKRSRLPTIRLGLHRVPFPPFGSEKTSGQVSARQ